MQQLLAGGEGVAAVLLSVSLKPDPFSAESRRAVRRRLGLSVWGKPQPDVS